MGTFYNTDTLRVMKLVLHDPEWSWNPAALLTNTFSLTKCRPRLDLVLTSRPPSAPQRAAVLLPPAHRQTLHQEEGEHGDGELPESCHEGAAQQVTTTVLINTWSCDIVVELEADHESIWCLRRCDVETLNLQSCFWLLDLSNEQYLHFQWVRRKKIDEIDAFMLRKWNGF